MIDIEASLKSTFPDKVYAKSEFRDNQRIDVPVSDLIMVLTYLKNQLKFDMLAELCGIDYLQYPSARDRYGVNYVLSSTETNQRIIIRTKTNDPDPVVPSVVPLWEGANWLEREVFDMFGIRFEGHPDLRRILLPPEFVSYPLRKDYPLRGKGERHNFHQLTRAES